MILALAAIGWVLFEASGGGKGDGAVPAEYRQSLEKAEALEQTLQDAAQTRLQALDNKEE
jgi:hypothetical protein